MNRLDAAGLPSNSAGMSSPHIEEHVCVTMKSSREYSTFGGHPTVAKETALRPRPSVTLNLLARVDTLAPTPAGGRSGSRPRAAEAGQDREERSQR